MNEGDATKKEYLLPGSILAAAVLISLSILYVASPSAERSGQARLYGNGETDEVQGGTSEITVAVNPVMTVGNQNAPVVMVEYSDYQCPYCGRFFRETLPKIKEKYIDTGKVRFVYKDFPLDSIHPHATPAAHAARCAGAQGKYWEMHDLLFNNQETLGEENYRTWARLLGLKSSEFEACMKDDTYRKAIREDLNEGQRNGISGTPGFLLNKELITGAQPYTVFEEAIERALKNTQTGL